MDDRESKSLRREGTQVEKCAIRALQRKLTQYEQDDRHYTDTEWQPSSGRAGSAFRYAEVAQTVDKTAESEGREDD